MPDSLKMPAIKRILHMNIVGVAFFSMVLTIALLSKIVIDSEQSRLEIETKSWAQIIALSSIKAIEEDNHKSLKLILNKLKETNVINYVHIYRFSEEKNQLVYFTSYNRSTSFPAIPNKISEVNKLTKPNYVNNYLELMLPITKNNHNYGYIYIQTNTQHLDKLITKIIYAAFFLVTIIFLVSLLNSLRLVRTITAAITILTENISRIFQTKDYRQRCEKMPYLELDILAKNINILLTRTEKNIGGLQLKEDELKLRNENLHVKINRRNQTIEEMNLDQNEQIKDWQEYQNNMLETEKMASLGSMVAGVAHEVNTPIGLGVTASTLLSDRLNEIKSAFEDKTLKSSQLKKFLNDGHINIDIIYRNLVRAADLISSFKKLAVDQSSEEDRQFNVKNFINDVFLTLAPQLTNYSMNINLICPDDLIITSKPGPINQILINLILNSQLHAFDGIENGKVTITVMNLSDQLNINYRDNGIGVSDTIKDKIFEPFTTTKRGEGGSGLGLHLVYNLVTQALQGTINLENPPEQGVIFDINFPVEVKRSE